MNGKDMLEWMNDLDDKAVVDADITPIRVKKRNGWKIGISVAAGVLAVALLTYVLYPYIKGKNNSKPDVTTGDGSSAIETQVLKVFEMAAPVYPASQSIKTTGEKYDEYLAYYTDITRTVLSDKVGENKVFSPLCMYMSLSMIAETSAGDTRQQILNILHQPDIESSRESAKSIWLSNYMDNGEDKLLLANSLWTNSGWTYEQGLMDLLASEYFASSFSGDPSDPDYSSAYREWLHDQTDGLLDEFLGDAQLDPGMVMTLVSSVNFSGKWEGRFSYPEEGVFHGTSGDVTTPFYKSDAGIRTYTGEHFISADAKLEGNGSVRFILPEEGMTPEQLLEDEELFTFMNDRVPEWDALEPTRRDPTVMKNPTLVMPLVDFSSGFDMKKYLRKMGVTDAFDNSRSDFTPLSKDGQGGLFISAIEHDARIMIDEDGCRAVAATIGTIGYGEPNFYDQIVLDRPYIVEIVSESGLPIFVGIVNNVE